MKTIKPQLALGLTVWVLQSVHHPWFMYQQSSVVAYPCAVFLADGCIMPKVIL
ncbi:hypothetical protein [Moraxella bovis]|uniref:hypothetical protein n=1 Tax=Moraxella bovis TaxID=476 RepID=UPI0015F1A41C|nr:hypothetical protein [Moraxella bovis]